MLLRALQFWRFRAKYAHMIAMRILIVEDNANAGEALCTLLRMDEHDAELAASLSEAEELMKARDFDLAFVDIGMPDGDGRDLVGPLKAGGMRVWLVTGTSSVAEGPDGPRLEDTGVLARACGADGHLTKPVDYAQLLQVVSQPLS